MHKQQIAALRIASADQALSKEQKAFNSRMQQVEKLRARFAAWENATPEYQRKYTESMAPLLERTTELEIELAQALDRALDYKGLTKTEQRKLEDMLRQLTISLLADVDDPALKAIYNKRSGGDYDQEEAELASGMKDVLENVFGLDLGDDADNDSPEEFARRAQAAFAEKARQHEEQVEAQQERRAPRRKSAKQQEKEAQAAAEAKAVDLSIRDIYRKLASALHPDREPDPQERQRKTALMQRINQAYDKRDLLQLLELQLELEHIDRDHIARLSEERLRHYNAVLKEQIAELKLELQRVEFDFRFRFDIAPFIPLKPETALRDLAIEIQEGQNHNRDLERDVQALTDAKSTKAWLKAMRYRPPVDDLDFPFF